MTARKDINWIDPLPQLDDWQRGFVDAVLAAQNIERPTQEQLSFIFKRMTAYVIRRNGGEFPADGRISFAKRLLE